MKLTGCSDIFNSKHFLKILWKFLRDPASMCLLVVAFLLLGIYGRVIWLIISIIILGIGHIGIQLQHLKELNEAGKS